MLEVPTHRTLANVVLPHVPVELAENRRRAGPDRRARLNPTLLKSDGRLSHLAIGRKEARTAQNVKLALHQGRLMRERYVHGGGGNRTQSTPRETGRYAAFTPYRHSTPDTSGHEGT